MKKEQVSREFLLNRWNNGEFPSLVNFDIFPDLLFPKVSSSVSMPHFPNAVKSASFFEVTLETSEEFLSLMTLVPNSAPLSLKSVALEMFENGKTFEDKALNESWFEQCLSIYNNFSFDRMCPLVLTDLNAKEKQISPESKFSLNHRGDGNHRSQVYALKLILDEEKFQPVNAIYFTPHLKLKRNPQSKKYELFPS